MPSSSTQELFPEPTMAIEHFDNPVEDDNEAPKRSKRQRTAKSFGHDFIVYLVDDTPTSISEAYASQDADYWKEAVRSEMDSILANGTWEVTDRPYGCKPVGCKWVFKKKLRPDGTIEKYKARLVAKGYTQKEGFWERSATWQHDVVSDDEFLHTDNFFPDLSDFFDNLNMGDNDAAMKPEGPLSAEEQEKFEKVDAMFKAALFNILGDNIVDPYMAFDHGKDAWDALEAKFGVSDAGTELYVMEQYYDYRMTDERSVVEQLMRFSRKDFLRADGKRLTCFCSWCWYGGSEVYFGKTIQLKNVQHEMPSSSTHELFPEPTMAIEHFDNPVEDDNEAPKRSKRQRTAKSFGHDFIVYLVDDTPTSISEAYASQDADYWKEAVRSEMDSILANGTWEVTDRPYGCKPVGCKWVFKKKLRPDGTIEKYKARLVAKGYTQKEGEDFFDTYSPVARLTTIRVLLSLAASHGLLVHQMDVKTAFLNGELEEEIYMEHPDGFVVDGQEGKVCKLLKSLYGLKQAPKQWHEKFERTLTAEGFVVNEADKCVYYRHGGGEGVILCLYVDDILIFGTSLTVIKEVKEFLSRCFEMKDLGVADVILNIKLLKDDDGGITLLQSHYVEKIPSRFGYSDCKSSPTPYDPSVIIRKNKRIARDQLRYSQIIGSLMYLASATRPDISFAVSKLSRFVSRPGDVHWHALERVLRYLKGTASYGIHYTGYPRVLEGYSDANWISDADETKATSGYLFTLGGGAVSWKSCKQTIITRSTMEAELTALDTATVEAEWLRELLMDLPVVEKPIPAIPMNCDNQTVIVKVLGALRATTGSTTSSSDDEFLHTDNFFPDLSDFFDNLNMGDNDAAMKYAVELSPQGYFRYFSAASYKSDPQGEITLAADATASRPRPAPPRAPAPTCAPATAPAPFSTPAAASRHLQPCSLAPQVTASSRRTSRAPIVASTRCQPLLPVCAADSPCDLLPLRRTAPRSGSRSNSRVGLGGGESGLRREPSCGGEGYRGGVEEQLAI
ncbi:hypothetical protein QYE76_029947 [Lolium multiflorum]|uniref:Reverse transcriptase Ty1/copia-type domain-containing protein n=1 Tax=Lolium multiflorum TaxID=4521 RepID=A0AAD8VH59_LOLMU|nr:hypothetical protein QYE76_029947 [Lolium multiflorum]